MQAEITAMVHGVVAQTAALHRRGASAEQCRQLVEAAMVELANAGGISMYGKELHNPYPGAPEQVQQLAHMMGTKATPYRNKLFAAPYEKASVGSSALITCTDASTGETLVLLERPQPGSKYGQHWMLPAGYMDPLPAADATLPDRINPEKRSALEEGLLHNAGQASPAQTSAALHGRPLPDIAQSHAVLYAHYKTLLKEQGWQQAYKKMSDDDYVEQLLTSHGLAVPPQPDKGARYDLSPVRNIKREILEETGVDVDAFPQAKVTPVVTNLSLGYSSGGQRPYTVNPHFLVDLGTLATPPAPAPQDVGEIAEAVWVPLKSIARSPSGEYMVTLPGREQEPKLSLFAQSIPMVEKSLNTLLADKIHAASGGRFDSARNVLAASTGWAGKVMLEDDRAAAVLARAAATAPLAEDGTLPTLTGPQGQALLTTYTALAASLAREPAARAVSGLTRG